MFRGTDSPNNGSATASVAELSAAVFVISDSTAKTKTLGQSVAPPRKSSIGVLSPRLNKTKSPSTSTPKGLLFLVTSLRLSWEALRRHFLQRRKFIQRCQVDAFGLEQEWIKRQMKLPNRRRAASHHHQCAGHE